MANSRHAGELNISFNCNMPVFRIITLILWMNRTTKYNALPFLAILYCSIMNFIYFICVLFIKVLKRLGNSQEKRGETDHNVEKNPKY